MTDHGNQIDLSDPAFSGVYPLHADDLQPLQDALAASDIQLHVVDLSLARGKPQLMALLADTLQFPSTFGHNWDALADCLGDLSWLPETGHALLLRHAAAMQESDANSLDILLDILEDATAQWTVHDVPLLVFMLEEEESGHVATPAADNGSTADSGIRFTLDAPHIALNDLLKLVGLCDSGGAGKALVASGQVYVDGRQELRKTCKIRAGQQVRLGGTVITVAAPDVLPGN